MISEEFTIAQTAVKIISSQNFEQIVYIHNDHGNKVYIGGSDVSSTNGFHLANDTNINVRVPQDNELYAISASGSGDIHILRPS
jgi:hypothetical protein